MGKKCPAVPIQMAGCGEQCPYSHFERLIHSRIARTGSYVELCDGKQWRDDGSEYVGQQSSESILNVAFISSKHTRTRTYINAMSGTYRHTHTNTQTHTHIRTHTHTHTHKYIHLYTQKYTRSYTITYSHTWKYPGTILILILAASYGGGARLVCQRRSDFTYDPIA
jgi:hypothetical protein